MLAKTKEQMVQTMQQFFRLKKCLWVLCVTASTACTVEQSQDQLLPDLIAENLEKEASPWQQTSGWTHFETSNQSSQTIIEFEVKVLAERVDAVIGAGPIAANEYSALATIIRFNDKGFIDARSGDNYESDQAIPYLANQTYLCEFSIDASTKTYNAYVTTEAGERLLVKENALFRSEQAEASQLKYISLFETNDRIQFRNIIINGTLLETLPPIDDSNNNSDGFLSVDFEQSPLGNYTDDTLRSDWPGIQYSILENRVSVEEEASNKFIRVRYPRGGVGPSDGGATWALKFDRSENELYVSYRMRFSSGFDFVKGGKLPGLDGGVANTGGSKPNGSDGWSGRLMWRQGGSVVQYLYHPDQPSIYGEDLPWNETFPTGQWVDVETRIVMNTPGQRDGVVQSWFNGKLALDKRDVRFRDVDSFAIDGFQFSSFFGGATSDWAPTKDETIDFDSFVFSDVPITH